jgi:hypothetical protein
MNDVREEYSPVGSTHLYTYIYISLGNRLEMCVFFSMEEEREGVWVMSETYKDIWRGRRGEVINLYTGREGEGRRTIKY